MRQVQRPRDEVFAYTADFSHSAEWDPGVVSSRRIGEGPVERGARFALEVEFGSGTTPMTYEITEYEPDSRVVLVGRGEKVEAVDEIRFESRDGTTLIDYTADLTFHNYLKYLGPFVSPLIRRVGTRAMDGLAGVLSR
ncbi:MAG: SRPBCC family protein [Actinomycetota bacterium]